MYVLCVLAYARTVYYDELLFCTLSICKKKYFKYVYITDGRRIKWPTVKLTQPRKVGFFCTLILQLLNVLVTLVYL